LMNVYFICYFAFGFTQARLFLHNTCISFLGLIINCRISTLSDHWGF
jgi:hypothetical protein